MNPRWAVAAILVAMLASGALASDDPPSKFRQANEAYRAKEFAKALVLYRSLVERIRNPVLYYNWGTAAFKAGHLGEAIMATEKARRLSPRDPDVRANLRFLRERVKDSVPEDEHDFVTRFLIKVLDGMASNELAIAVSAALWAACLLACCLVAGRSREPTRLLKGLLIASLVCLSVALGPLILKLYLEEHQREAIVLSPEVHVLSGPGTDEIKRFTLHEGTRVFVVKDWNQWVHISLPNGENGWTLSERVGRI